MCNTGQDVKLQDTHTQHQDEGSNPKQHTKEISKLSQYEYAAPVWERSAHAHLLNPELNHACRAIKSNKLRELVFARGNCPSGNQKKCMCKSGKNQTGRERDPLPVWAHTSKKTSKVEKKLPYKCATNSLPSKSCQESTNRRGDWRRRHMQLSQPVRGSSHGA